jgi:hypothetical protein
MGAGVSLAGVGASARTAGNLRYATRSSGNSRETTKYG